MEVEEVVDVVEEVEVVQCNTVWCPKQPHLKGLVQGEGQAAGARLAAVPAVADGAGVAGAGGIRPCVVNLSAVRHGEGGQKPSIKLMHQNASIASMIHSVNFCLIP